MKKKGVLCSILLGILLLFTGCRNPFDYMPDLTEEESAAIAEYTAGILIKHDKYAGRLASDTQIAEADAREKLRQENIEAFHKTSEEAVEEEQQDTKEKPSSASGGGEAAQAEVPFAGIAQFCQADGFTINYTGYMISESYPAVEEGDMVFAMDASPGNKLLVLQFTAQNETAEDKELDIFDKNIKFRVSINDGGMESMLTTLLLDDLSSYKGTVPAGESIPLVLVKEVPEAEEITTISLMLKNEAESTTTLLE